MTLVHSGREAVIPTETEAAGDYQRHTFHGDYITARLRFAATAQCKGYTVPIYPKDVLWLVQSHGNLLSVLSEMFCDGPVDVAFAGNPTAIADLEGRVRAAIDRATAASSVGTKASAEVNQKDTPA